jgi:hypothetical protein
LGRPSSKAVITAWSDGAFAKSRHAAETEIDLDAARNKMFNTTVAVHFQPRSRTSFACNNHWHAQV